MKEGRSIVYDENSGLDKRRFQFQ